MNTETVETPENPVVVERDGHVAVVVLNRPEAINAINAAMKIALPQVLQALDDDPDVRVVVMAGAGPRGFCAGADIKGFTEPETSLRARKRLLQAGFTSALDRFSKPTIAALHGHCLGGGMEIALACDLRVAAQDTLLALPEINLGLMPGAGGTQRLPRLVGLGRALELMLLGDRIGAEEALRIGIVNRVVATSADVRAEAVALAQRIAQKPPAAAAAVKEATRVGSTLDLATGMRLEKDLFALLLATEDKLEAATAFKEKRAPRFTGR
ncbi:enoyl-CoA hydratase/isomerase family protein [Hydrogenophaga sp.]|uniref:enoyl-CoA hydratase/isomerase family protein n=1 Tax=Hydrogenophaga sp. TaxID=1904254 RepID=UPI0035B1E6F4